MEKTFTVLEPHLASYPDPIVLRLGDCVRFKGRDEFWDGARWLWVIAADGREGWVPDDLLDMTGPSPVAKADYSAAELTCAQGEVLSGLDQTHGWVWCRNGQGRQGWVPSRNLGPGGKIPLG